MTTGDYPPPPPPDPDFPPPPGGYPPPPPGYGPPTGYPVPQYGQSGAYPPPQAPAVGQPAGLGIRIAARFIDGLVIAIVSTLLSSLFSGNSTYLGMHSFSIVAPVFSGLLAFAYFTVFEGLKGWTPGKKLLGLAVRGAAGAAQPDVRQAAIRNAFTLLALIPCLNWVLVPVAFLVIAITINSSPTKQGTHDQLAGGTQVVKS